jgi:glycosyltransferase involved in cell wall biosynthesis
VVAVFGTVHPTRMTSHVERAVLELKERGHRVVVFNLGADVPPLAGLEGHVPVRAPGRLEPPELASWLAASDLFLIPLSDGVSTRRTTLMAALQHGLPVVGTRGPLTDTMLGQRPDALHLVPAHDQRRFVEEVSRLSADPEQRAALGRSGRELYERHFAWPQIAARTLLALGLDDPEGVREPVQEPVNR